MVVEEEAIAGSEISGKRVITGRWVINQTLKQDHHHLHHHPGSGPQNLLPL
jgi:hypothetical protein